MTGQIIVSMQGRGIARLTLNRPDKHNALSAEMMDALTVEAGRIGADKAVRVVILDAVGRSFCAGGDLDWMRAQIDADRATRRTEALRLAGMLRALNQLPQPLIARVQGNCFGGGVGLLSVCDAACAVDTARFGLTETRLGLIPATIGPYVFARMGVAHARRCFMSSRLFGADEALRYGLISNFVPSGDLDTAIDDEVVPYLATAPGAVAEAKAMLRALSVPIDDALIDRNIDALVSRWESAEATEGLAAFFEKRPPSWTL